ncbi:MAG: hypothetical protein ACTS6H_02890 [Candidatus Hodgkinia cicadicola]
MTLTYYRILFIVHENVNRNIINNLCYVDKCLRSIGFKNVCVKEYIICYTYIILIVLNRMVLTYRIIHDASFGCGACHAFVR